MITEKQVVQYLKNKDQDYIDNLLERIKNSCSINVKSESKIFVLYVVRLLSRKMAKIPMKNNVIFVMTVIDLLVKTLKPLFFCSHFTKDQWLKFIDYEISGYEAYFMNTSITTCFYMRHKLIKQHHKSFKNKN